MRTRMSAITTQSCRVDDWPQQKGWMLSTTNVSTPDEMRRAYDVWYQLARNHHPSRQAFHFNWRFRTVRICRYPVDWYS